MKSTIAAVFLSILPVCFGVTVFPYTPYQWDGGFRGNITLQTDTDLCGWRIRINFNDTVVGIIPYNIRIAGRVRENTDVFAVREETYNYEKTAGSVFNLEFNGNLTSGVAVSVTSAVITKTTRGQWMCNGQTSK